MITRRIIIATIGSLLPTAVWAQLGILPYSGAASVGSSDIAWTADDGITALTADDTTTALTAEG